MTRHFLRDDDLLPSEQAAVLELTSRMKHNRFGQQPLAGPRSVALVFDKPSTRTRVSFAVGVGELGGLPLTVDSTTSQLGRGEPVEDTARVLDRQVAAIVWRTFEQERLEAVAEVSSVPVINALTDEFHPCQLLADLFTVREHHGELAGQTLTYLGDGANNMAHSYLLAGATAGLHVRIASPAELAPDPAVLARAEKIAVSTQGSVAHVSDPAEAVRGSDVLATDTWVSMGDEEAAEEHLRLLTPYRLDQAALDRAADGAIVLHCLPAYRGLEITAEVLDGPASVVWDQAENRLHAQKALLAWLLGERRHL